MISVVKDFLGRNKVKIGVVAGFVTVVAIGLFVGDITIGQVKDCVLTFSLDSGACQALTAPSVPA